MDINNAKKLEASCHCRAVQITLTRLPEYVHDCNCSLCRKCGGVWGYFSGSDVQISGATDSYKRSDIPSATIQVHFCNVCGSTTHWFITDEYRSRFPDVDRMGVNMRLFEADQLAGIEVRFPNGKGWDGKGDFDYYRDPIVYATAG